ncbi:MAG: hypothetical protein WC700_04165 [Gemmatimonadaceae bacterium]
MGVERAELTAEKVPELAELFSGLKKLPLAESDVEIEIEGVPVAVINALRRTVVDEMPGRALQVPPAGFDTEKTTEVFMIPQFVNARIANIPLRAQIPKEVVAALRLRLDVSNPGTEVLSVYAGDLRVVEGKMPEPLFNPTFRIATLQPGKRIYIDGIRIASGYGRDDGVFIVARNAAFRHVDLPQRPREETHLRGGAAVDESGYAVSSLVADPRRHVLMATIPATGPDRAEVRAVFADACDNVVGRLRLVATAAERRGDSRGAQYTVVPLESGLTEGILRVPGETYTVGEVLRRAVFERTPDVANVSYVVADGALVFTLRHASEDVTKILVDAATSSIAVFDAIRNGIMAAK